MSQNQIQLVNAESVTGLANHFVKTGWFKDTNDVSKAVVKIMAGQEMGVGPMASMKGINIIQGQPAMSANLLASQVKNSGKYNYKVAQSTNEICELEFFELWNGKFESMGKVSFTFEEAKKAGLTSKANWLNYTSDMLFARAISRGARRFCPDVFNGNTAYVPEELENIESPQSVTSKPTVEPKKPTQAQLKRYFALVNEYAQAKGKTKQEVEANIKKVYKFESHSDMSLAVYNNVTDMLENALQVEPETVKEGVTVEA